MLPSVSSSGLGIFFVYVESGGRHQFKVVCDEGVEVGVAGV